jgi:hypothetical protein
MAGKCMSAAALRESEIGRQIWFLCTIIIIIIISQCFQQGRRPTEASNVGNLLYLGNLDPPPLLALDTTNEAGWLAGWLALEGREGPSNLDTVFLTLSNNKHPVVFNQ